jgi:cellobiose-specific phosphotransferase system component IIA
MPRLTGRPTGTGATTDAPEPIKRKSPQATDASAKAKAKRAADKKVAATAKKIPKSKPVDRKVIGEKAPKKKAPPKAKALADLVQKGVDEMTSPHGASVAHPAEAADKRQELVVFAFRLPESERNLIHNAAGRGKATSFAREALAAVARGDADRVKELMADAAKNRVAL